MLNLYKFFRVRKDATPKLIKKKFKRKISRYAAHLIKSDGLSHMEAIRNAYLILIDPAERSKHDVELGLLEQGEKAAWRKHYQDYSRQQMEEDLQYADLIIEKLVGPGADSASWASVFILIIFFSVLVYIFAGILLAGV